MEHPLDPYEKPNGCLKWVLALVVLAACLLLAVFI